MRDLKLYIAIVAIGSLFLLSCEEESTLTPLEVMERQEIIIEEYLENNNISDYNKTESGIYYYEIEPGAGVEVPEADTVVSVHYTGEVLYGDRFDSSRFGDEPFEFQVGTGRIVSEYDSLNNPVFSGSVIRGWVEAVSLMNVGETSRFYIPSSLAYGSTGSGSIPGNTVIFFDIEVLGLK